MLSAAINAVDGQRVYQTAIRFCTPPRLYEIDSYNYFSPLFYRKVAMTINWKQGLFAAALLLSVSLLIVGCGKCKTDKAVADKSAGEIIGEEVDVIEVVPAQTPNANSNAAGEQNNNAPAAPAQQGDEIPAMTPPTTTPDAPTTQTPTTDSDAAPSSTTSDVTVSTSCSDAASEHRIAENQESEPVIESETTSCCTDCYSDSACNPACTPAVEACQSACDAALTCAPDPVCAPDPACLPAPVCAPACRPCCTPCRHHHIRRCCRPCHVCCRARVRCIRVCLPCSAACAPACVSTCMSACDPDCQSVGCTNEDCNGSWSTEQRAPAEPAPKTTQPKPQPNKASALPDPKINDASQKANASKAVGSTPTTPETPSIVLPEAK